MTITTSGNPNAEPYLILAQELMRNIYADMPADELHAWLLAQIKKLGSVGETSAAMTWAESFDYYENLLRQRVERAALPPEQRSELNWAWSSWNRMIDPLEPGLVALLAAGDGMGKTIYCESQAEYWARNGHKVAFVHFELNRAIMLDRRATRHTLITRRQLRSGPFDAALYQTWHAARQRLAAWDGAITYWHTPGWSMEQVIQHMEQAIAGGACDVIVIDYLEKAQPSTRQAKLFGSNQYQREADDVELIKTFAERTETPVLLLAQMNKGGKTAGISTIDRTNVRGAGEKTEKANIVILLNRAKEPDGAYSSVVDVRIDKNTLGPTGNFTQFMRGEFFTVGDNA